MCFYVSFDESYGTVEVGRISLDVVCKGYGRHAGVLLNRCCRGKVCVRVCVLLCPIELKLLYVLRCAFFFLGVYFVQLYDVVDFFSFCAIIYFVFFFPFLRFFFLRFFVMARLLTLDNKHRTVAAKTRTTAKNLLAHFIQNVARADHTHESPAESWRWNAPLEASSSTTASCRLGCTPSE